MTLMALCTVRWEKKACEERKRQAEDPKAWLAHAFQLATPPTPFKDRSLTERATLKRLVNSLGYT